MRVLQLSIRAAVELAELIVRITIVIVALINRWLARHPSPIINPPPKPLPKLPAIEFQERPKPELVVNKPHPAKPTQEASEGIKDRHAWLVDIMNTRQYDRIWKDEKLVKETIESRGNTLDHPDGSIRMAVTYFNFRRFKVIPDRIPRPFVLPPLMEEGFAPGIEPLSMPAPDGGFWIASAKSISPYEFPPRALE